MLEDRSITCRDCGCDFLFSAEEQAFFKTKGLDNEPKRCANCRLVMRFKRKGQNIANLYDAVCEACSAPAKVPFQPKGHKPVYCTLCMMTKKSEQPVRREVAV